MKKKNISKKVLAVLLSFIMIATSVPFGIMVSAAGDYDPAPKFSDEAIKEGARAWLDDEGNVHVAYPAANAEPTYKGEALSIAFYILELVDMGPNNETHTNVVLDTIKATGTEGTFAAADIGEIDLENSRYSVTVTAVDTENWFSQPLYTTVTDVPVAEIDGSRFANFSTSATAVREMATFDGETESDNSATTTGNALLYMGTAEEAGTEDLSDNIGDTSALRFIMNDMPSGTQNFYTSYSRETWDFKGAEEVWYWLDFSKVSIQGMAFNLGAQCKDIVGWASTTIDVTENEVIHYSTKGTTASTYTGEAPYVWVQREDGGWNKIMMTNGTIDLANFKGYVRVPIKFFCSTENRYVTATNTAFGTDKSSIVASSIWAWANQDDLKAETQANGDAYVATLKGSTQILADAAGTPITEALMLQRRYFKCSACKIVGVASGGNLTWDLGYMPAAAVGADSADDLYKATTDAKRATVNLSAGTVTRNENTYRAIEDLKTMGFSFENCSSDSLQNSFFVDNIFFYRTDGGAYPENSLNGEANTGSPMTTYYNEENAIAKIIFDEIDKYISDPDWADYRELEYVLELIDEYRTLYTTQGKDTTFLNLTRSPETTGLAGMATKLNREDTWEKAWKAWEACYNEGTIASDGSFPANAGKDDLVPSIVNTLEKLPHPDNITSVSDVLRAEIVKLWQAYSLLNLGQLEMLGKVEEETLLKYFALVENLDELDGDEFIVGQQLADYPYIVYNDFENQELGTKGWQLEDNKDTYSTGFTSANGVSAGTHNPSGGVYTMAGSWRHLKGLVTYTTDGDENVIDKDLYGYSPTDGEYKQEVMDNKLHYNASSVSITDNGYLHSNAATMDIDSSFKTESDYEGVFHTVTFSRHGKDSNTYNEFKDNNTGLDGLGNFSTKNATGTASIGLSLIMYVDFSEIESFYFSTNIYALDGGTEHKFRVDMGSASLGNISDPDAYKQEHWKYFILDPNTGEWKINHTTSQYAFTSAQNASWGDELSLDGYKGYLMVPLYHIKSGAVVLDGSDKLDCNSDWLNSIYAIQFCIGGANNTSLDEKSFTIDNVGFTYDPAAYADHEWSSYAEIFEAKSLPASEFEAAVDAIDPYDETTIDSTTAAARAIYNTLPAYQQSLVIDAYKTLLIYEGYAVDHNTIPQPTTVSVDLATWITNNLTSDATNAKVTGVEKDANGNIITDYDLTHPGYVIENGAVVPNYAAYGLTADLAVQIIEFYNNSYAYYTVAEKQVVKDLGFLNAYNAAMRCTESLENIKADSFTFLPEITALYSMKYDYDGDGILEDLDETVANSDDYKVGNFIYIGEKNADGEYEGVEEVSTFKTEKYNPLQYYSKTSIDDGTIYSQLTNTSRGFTYFLNNTREFVVDGETIEGGILTFRDKMQDIYDMANDHITNKTLFTDEELQSVRDIIQEYNALLPAYYNVEELYELEQAILRLFPEYQTSMGEQTLMLSEENLSKSTEYTIEYSEYLDITDPYTDTLYVKVVSQNGYMTNDYGDIVNYNVTLKSNEYNSYTVDASQLAGLTEANWAATYSVTNNASTPDGTQEAFTLTAGVSAAQTGLHGMVTDVLILQLCHPDGTVLEEQTVQVFYSMGDAYTVTIPAEFPVSWDDSDPQDVSYTANTEMNAASSIKVKVSSDGTGKLTNTVTQDVLTYATENFDVVTTFSGMVTDGEQDPAPTVTVSGWDDVPVGEYRTTLTYTVEYDDGTT